MINTRAGQVSTEHTCLNILMFGLYNIPLKEAEDDFNQWLACENKKNISHVMVMLCFVLVCMC